MSSSDSDGYQPGTTSSIRHKFTRRRRQAVRQHRGGRRWPGYGIVLPPMWMMNSSGPGYIHPSDECQYYYTSTPYQYHQHKSMSEGGIRTPADHDDDIKSRASTTTTVKKHDRARSTTSGASKRLQLARQHAAVVRIQQWWKNKLPKIRGRNEIIDEICLEISQQLLEDFIRGEFLPDLFLDIIADDSNRYAPYTEELAICKDIIDGISNDVISDLLRITMRDAINNMVESYLGQCSAERYRHLFQSILDSLIDDECHLVLPDLIRDVAQSMVNEYLQYVEYLAYTEAIIAPLVDEIIIDICEHVYIEQWANVLIQDMTQEIVINYCNEFLEGALQVGNQDRIRGEVAIVQQYSTIILNQSILQILLHKLATNDENATIGCQLMRILDRAILDRCLDINYSLDNEIQQVNNNIALWSLHDTTVSQISVDVVLALLQDQLQAELDLQ